MNKKVSKKNNKNLETIQEKRVQMISLLSNYSKLFNDGMDKYNNDEMFMKYAKTHNLNITHTFESMINNEINTTIFNTTTKIIGIIIDCINTEHELFNKMEITTANINVDNLYKNLYSGLSLSTRIFGMSHNIDLNNISDLITMSEVPTLVIIVNKIVCDFIQSILIDQYHNMIVDSVRNVYMWMVDQVHEYVFGISTGLYADIYRLYIRCMDIIILNTSDQVNGLENTIFNREGNRIKIGVNKEGHSCGDYDRSTFIQRSILQSIEDDVMY